MERIDKIKVKIKKDKWKGYKLKELYNNGLIRAINKETGLYGFFNIEGNIIIPFIYEEASGFNTKYSLVKQNGKYGIINAKGEIIIPVKYKKAWFVINKLNKDYCTQRKYTHSQICEKNRKMPNYKGLYVEKEENDIFALNGNRLVEDTKVIYISNIDQIPNNYVILEILAFYSCLRSTLLPNLKIEIEEELKSSFDYEVEKAIKKIKKAEEDFPMEYAKLFAITHPQSYTGEDLNKILFEKQDKILTLSK